MLHRRRFDLHFNRHCASAWYPASCRVPCWTNAVPASCYNEERHTSCKRSWYTMASQVQVLRANSSSRHMQAERAAHYPPQQHVHSPSRAAWSHYSQERTPDFSRGFAGCKAAAAVAHSPQYHPGSPRYQSTRVSLRCSRIPAPVSCSRLTRPPHRLAKVPALQRPNLCCCTLCPNVARL
jgi:hypothetical protein